MIRGIPAKDLRRTAWKIFSNFRTWTRLDLEIVHNSHVLQIVYPACIAPVYLSCTVRDLPGSVIHFAQPRSLYSDKSSLALLSWMRTGPWNFVELAVCGYLLPKGSLAFRTSSCCPHAWLRRTHSPSMRTPFSVLSPEFSSGTMLQLTGTGTGNNGSGTGR